ncbi:hypothetical protein BC567DRAFT_218657 [Phyllosticta citribraziliensis]
MLAGLMLMDSRSAFWYCTVKFRTSTSVPYTLHPSFSARLSVAVNPYAFLLTCEALYPGQTSCASTASESSMLAISGAPVSASAGTVKRGA